MLECAARASSWRARVGGAGGRWDSLAGALDPCHSRHVLELRLEHFQMQAAVVRPARPGWCLGEYLTVLSAVFTTVLWQLS